MSRDGVTAAALDVLEDALQPLVGERLDPAAVVADDVMVVLDRIAMRFETRDAVAEIHPLHKPLLCQRVEHAVHAREADPLTAGLELAMDLLRADAAVLRVEVLEHSPPCEAAPVASCL